MKEVYVMVAQSGGALGRLLSPEVYSEAELKEYGDTPLEGAQNMIKRFNDTLRPGEKPRYLARLQKVTYTPIEPDDSIMVFNAYYSYDIEDI